MPVSNFTYIYLIFAVTELMVCIMAVVKRDEEKTAVHLLAASLMFIGYMCNRYYSMQIL